MEIIKNVEVHIRILNNDRMICRANQIVNGAKMNNGFIMIPNCYQLPSFQRECFFLLFRYYHIIDNPNHKWKYSHSDKGIPFRCISIKFDVRFIEQRNVDIKHYGNGALLRFIKWFIHGHNTIKHFVIKHDNWKRLTLIFSIWNYRNTIDTAMMLIAWSIWGGFEKFLEMLK